MILKTAIKVIAREGFRNTRMQTIADEARTAVGTIYLYFKSKDDILGRIIMNEHQKRVKFLNELENEAQPALDKLTKFLHFHIDTLMDDIDVCKILIQEVVLTNMTFSDEVLLSVNKMQQLVYNLIVRAQEEGSIREADPEILLITLLNMLKGFMYALLNKKDMDNYTVLKNQAINFLINGLKV